MHRRVPAIDTEKIGPLGCMILLRLQNIAPVQVQRLVDEMGRDPSQMTRVVRRLETKGFITRCAHETDRRISVLCLSAAGADMASELEVIMSDVVNELLTVLSPSERHALSDLLSRL